MSDRTLVLLDGNAALYRAFYAIPALSTAAGRPTNAVFGFVRMVRQLRQKLKPTHMISVFDGGVPAWRLALLDTYKAQRPSMPELLSSQFPLAERYLEEASIPWLRMESEEADDVIATLALRAEEDGASVVIATNDKDLFQLVSLKTSIVLPSDTDRVMTREDVERKTGVSPDKIVEWLALVGDTSDNIKGVPGVGPKTAAKLLERYGSAGGIMGNVGEISQEGLRRSLESSRDVVLRNLELVRLKRDLSCSVDWNAAEVKPEDPARLLPFFRELELNSLAKEMERAAEKDFFDT